MEKKICPMSLKASLGITTAECCAKEGCAWYLSDENACAVTALTGNLHDVKLVLTEMGGIAEIGKEEK